MASSHKLELPAIRAGLLRRSGSAHGGAPRPPRLPTRKGVDFGAFGLILGALLLAAFAGLVTSYVPWLFTLLLVLMPLVLVLSLKRPHIGLIVALMFIYEVVPSAFQPRVPFGGGRLQSYDLLLLYVGAIVFLQAWRRKQSPLQAMGPFRWPLYYLGVCMFASLLYVRYFAPNALMLGEARTAIAWLVVPLTALACNTPTRYRWLLRSVIVMATLIALYVTIQSLFGVRIMTGARVEALDNSVNSDIVRSIAGGGIYIVIFALFLLVNRVVQRRVGWWWAVPLSLLLVAGLAVQYGRGVWIATAVGLLVSALLFRGVGGVIRVVLVGGFTIGLMLSAASVYKPRIAEAIVTRATGIGAELESGGSFNWRKLENDAAVARIERDPLTGTGLGGQYKQTTSGQGHFDVETTYIHNSYLFFPLKMGIFAVFIPFAFMAAFVVTVRQGLIQQRNRNPDRALVAALCGAFVVPVITGYTQSEWTSPQGIACFAVFMGLALLYRQMGSPLAARLASV